MIYNLTNPLDAQSAKVRFEQLAKKGAVIELSEKRRNRTLSQNNYLHLLLGYFACQTGNTLAWVKEKYYKQACNADLYVEERDDALIGRVTSVKSSRDLNTEEMNLSIERFRNWSASEAGVYLPEPTSEAEIMAMQIEVERYRQYL